MNEDYAKQISSLRAWLLGRGYHQSLKILELCIEVHSYTRKDGLTPFYIHPISVCNYLRTLDKTFDKKDRQDIYTIALGHDLLEDHFDETIDVIKTDFSNVFGELSVLNKNYANVKPLTKRDNTGYYSQLSDYKKCSIVKGADRIHNFQTMVGVFSPEKQREYIQECNDFIFPMLKKARRTFTRQEPAYENIKHVLKSQIQLLKRIS